MPQREELDRVILAAASALRPLARALRERCPDPECFEERLGLRFRPGERVWDLVTQQEVRIDAGTIENYIAAPRGRPPGGDLPGALP